MARCQAGFCSCAWEPTETGEDRILIFTLFFAGASRRTMED
jgi:hypothetical protein